MWATWEELYFTLALTWIFPPRTGTAVTGSWTRLAGDYRLPRLDCHQLAVCSKESGSICHAAAPQLRADSPRLMHGARMPGLPSVSRRIRNWRSSCRANSADPEPDPHPSASIKACPGRENLHDAMNSELEETDEGDQRGATEREREPRGSKGVFSADLRSSATAREGRAPAPTAFRRGDSAVIATLCRSTESAATPCERIGVDRKGRKETSLGQSLAAVDARRHPPTNRLHPRSGLSVSVTLCT
jgi:hypothetical protein